MTTNADIPVGTTVYLNWYDFQKQTEHTCKGVVVDNELWAGTKQADMLNVRFLVPGMSAPICHHFPAGKLSLTPDNVPHDDCYLVCGKNYQHDATVRQKSQQPSDAWQTLRKFKDEHWDQQHNHICIDALEEFYQRWRNAVAAKYGITIQPTASGGSPADTLIIAVDPASPDGDHSTKMIVDTETGEIVSYTAVSQQPQPLVTKELKQKMAVKLTAKQKRSTARIQYTDSIQTSIFD